MNTKRLVQTMLGTVQGWVQPAFDAVWDRFEAIEAKVAAIPQGEKGDKGDDADPELIRSLVAAAVDAIPRPKDGERGKDAEPIHPDTIARMVADQVRAQLSDWERPKDGKDVDPAFVRELVQAAVTSQVTPAVAAAVAAIPTPENGQPGKDADEEAIRARLRDELAEELAAAVKQIPRPENGKDATDEQIIRAAEPLIARMVAEIPRPVDGANGEPGLDGKDGRDGADGKDGAPGADGKDADHDAIVADVLAKVRMPEDGRPGKDADPEMVAASIDKAIAPVVTQFVDMADELLSSLEDDVAAPAPTPSLNVTIDGRKVDGRSSGFGMRDQLALGQMISNAVTKALMLPVKPVFDDKGNILYAQRVASPD